MRGSGAPGEAPLEVLPALASEAAGPADAWVRYTLGATERSTAAFAALRARVSR
jgi:hypothetical protein